jgi:tetratricopeptide (TPR) repeat protein
MKAFLSHSSIDKQFVQAVAKELGRQFCVFDEQSFATGEEFKRSIETGLDESSVFVLFASLKSLESLWVNFEIEEAWYRRLRATLSKSLVYIIDSSVQLEKIPEWLRRASIRRENAPKIIARDIRFHLDELLRRRQHPFFVGRSNEVEEIEQVLTPLDTFAPPHAIFVSGLPGIGRRSLIRRVAPAILNLRKFVDIRIGEGDSLHDICLIVADRIEPYSTKEGLERIYRQIQALSYDAAVDRTLENLRLMITAGELPIFYDEGGLLDNEGYVREPIRTILRKIAPNDATYIFFVSQRKPQRIHEINIPVVQVGPLREQESKRLLTMLAGQASLQISHAQIGDLSTYIAGYPPSAYFAVQQAKSYGLDLLIKEKAQLVQFRTSVFLQHLAKLGLSDTDQEILRILAVYSPLPLSVVGEVLNIDLEKLGSTLVKLIDLSLVITTQEGFFRIADPVAEAASKAFGFPSEDQHKALARKLNSYLQETQLDNARLELSRVLFRAALLSGDREISETTLHLANDLIRITETLYHEREYEESAKYGYAALEKRPDSVTARNFLIRSLIQQERWSEAETHIDELDKFAGQREVFFLKGFLGRKRGRIEQAINAYKEAERLGRRGVAISRELALCYFILGDQEGASKYIQEAIERHGDNRYVVDLWIQIATRRGDEKAARQALARLEVIDKPLHYFHRLSRVEFAFGNYQEAQIAAKKAFESVKRPPFEVIAQLIYCEIELDNIQDAENLLNELDRKFGNIRHDVRLGLRCRLEIAQKRFGKALTLSERSRDKQSLFHKKIRYDALTGELRNSALIDTTRDAYETELAELRDELTNVSTSTFIALELDTP